MKNEYDIENRKKVLFVSNSSPKKIIHILDSLQDRTDLVVEVEHQWKNEVNVSFMTKLFEKIKLTIDVDGLNERVKSRVDSFKPDIVFIAKGNVIKPSCLKWIKTNHPAVKLVSWSGDDMYAWHNRSLYYTLGLKLYDLVVTTKSYNVSELKRLGARRVLFHDKAFSKRYHKKAESCEGAVCADVLFIGFAEKERYEDLLFLAENGIVVTIYGSGWHKSEFSEPHKNLVINKYDLVGSDYSNAISCSKITLGFLRKINRDLQTSRSIEIPACGGFMLAERTSEHQRLLQEGTEAEFFSNKYELLEKVKKYLSDDDARERIASNGFIRTRRSDYSYDKRIDEILKELYES